ncbi:MAG TPA: amidohydrolase family protein [Acidobacteriota bacterium]|nr:amidohydrolase family protein [Acidobacteriota bacterium]
MVINHSVRLTAVLLMVACWSMGMGFGERFSIEGLLYLDKSPVSIEVVDGKISQIIRKDSLDDPALENAYIAPGLIDNQVNGYASVSFTSADLTAELVGKATRAQWKEGVTTYLPTVTTGPHETILKSFEALAEARLDPEISKSIPGFHLEGPYISPVDGYRGAHPSRWVRPPDWQEFLQYNKASGNRILQVSLAPEVEGGMDFLRKCIASGIRVALAHHNGSAETIRVAIDEGAVISTHLGNGCANTIHRHDNPLWPQLADDRLMASIIVDGFHLRPEEVQVFFKVKGPGRIIATSDVTKFAGMPPGEYEVDGDKVVMTPEGMLKLPSQDVLYGASLPLRTAIGNLMRFTGCSLADAVHVMTRNPAQLYGLEDRGEIKTGKRADLIVFTFRKGRAEIMKTYLAGNVVYSAN